MTSLSIIDAMDADALFAPRFAGDSRSTWRAFLAALFALPMTDEQLELFRRHTGRTAAPTQPFRKAALIVGRRGGKGRILALVAVYLATVKDYAPHLAAGEVA